MMKKIVILMLALVFVSMVFGADNAGPVKVHTSPAQSDSKVAFKRIMTVDEMKEFEGSRQPDSIYYNSLATYWNLGLAGYTWKGGLRFTPTELASYAGWQITGIGWDPGNGTPPQTDKLLEVYSSGTQTNPGPVVSSQLYSSTGGAWQHRDLTTPVPISGAADIWISVQVYSGSGQYPLSTDNGPVHDYKSDWVYVSSWWELRSPPNNMNRTWIMAAIVDQVIMSDVGPVSVDMPSTVSPNTTLSPMATVKNFGSDPETFDVTCEIDPGGYSSTENVSNLAAGDSTQLTFTPDFTFVSGSYTVTVYSELGGDENPGNDTLEYTIDVVLSDVGTISIDIPSSVPPGTTLPPMATVKNLGTDPETFDVTCEIDPGGYSSTQNVSNLTAGDSTQVTFTPDFTFTTGTYTVTVYTELGGDEDPGNDTLEVVIDATGVDEWNPVTPKLFSFSTPSISRNRATIELALPIATYVDLQVYDVMGRLSEVIFSNRLGAGTHTMTFDLDLPAGVYFYGLKTDTGENVVEKFVIIE
jgi:hypothetical protein